jgi:LPS sulfotransferase NodH
LSNSRVTLVQKLFSDERVTGAILMASTFRSGSTFIAELLQSNGFPGLTYEKFNEIWRYNSAVNRVFQKNVSDIVQTARDGLFTTKMMWPHRSDFARCLRLERDDAQCFSDCFPKPKWIWVKRQDKIRQAISLWRAQKTARWHVFDEIREPVVSYDFDEIRECFRETHLHDIYWADFFNQASIEPFTIEYEAFCRDIETQLLNLLRFLGSSPEGSLSFDVSLKQQRDAYTEEIYERFMNDSYRYG